MTSDFDIEGRQRTPPANPILESLPARERHAETKLERSMHGAGGLLPLNCFPSSIILHTLSVEAEQKKMNSMAGTPH